MTNPEPSKQAMAAVKAAGLIIRNQERYEDHRGLGPVEAMNLQKEADRKAALAIDAAFQQQPAEGWAKAAAREIHVELVETEIAALSDVTPTINKVAAIIQRHAPDYAPIKEISEPAKHRMAGREIVRRADEAYRALMLGSFSGADMRRIKLVWDACWSLDEEQADAKDKLDALKRMADGLAEALDQIGTHWATDYDNPMTPAGDYGKGVVDGHRCCVYIGRPALAAYRAAFPAEPTADAQPAPDAGA